MDVMSSKHDFSIKLCNRVLKTQFQRKMLKLLFKDMFSLLNCEIVFSKYDFNVKL